MNRLHALLFLPALLALGPPTARAETLGTCSGFITSLPVVISTQGNWCLDRDLATAIATGAAVTISTNNVTLDCNGFKLGGLAAGNGSFARGIQGQDRLNITIRNCNIRGFYTGIQLTGQGSGHLVEHNRMDGNIQTAITLTGGDGSVIRDNMITDTGGSENSNFANVIQVTGNVDILDNLIAGAIPGTCCAAWGNTTGISSSGGNAALIARNRIHGLTRRENGDIMGILVAGVADGRPQVTGNHIVGADASTGIAVRCFNPTTSLSANYLAGFATPIHTCLDHGGNITN